MTGVLTELDLTVSDLAEIYYAHKWFPVNRGGKSDVDVEEKIRTVLRDLIGTIVQIPEREDGMAGTMRLHLEKDPDCNYASIYLQIGSVEW